MAYAVYEDYVNLYGGGEADEAAFGRLLPEAGRIMERAVTGVDGVCKLKAAPPEGDGAEAVKRCACALVRALWQAERRDGCVERSDGTVTGRVVTRVTAGQESVTYAAPDSAGGRRNLEDLAREYLAGVPDGNGVNLTYMGPPSVLAWRPSRLPRQREA